MTMTNAQAALIAAASSAPRGTTNEAYVKATALNLKTWLDGIDAQDLRARQQAGMYAAGPVGRRQN